MNKKLLIAAGIIIVAVLGYALTRGGGSSVDSTPTPTAVVSESPVSSIVPSESPVASTVKTFQITGKSFSFAPNQITVQKGDTVKIVFTNTEGFHDWVVDQFNAHTSRVQAGQTTTVQFVADKIGSFQYYCSVGNHRAQGMVGTLVVE